MRGVRTNSFAETFLRSGVSKVTIDKSLQRKGRLTRSRNVLKRGERIAQLKFDERWQDGQSPLGLPKVRVVKVTVGKKKKKKKAEESEDEDTSA